MLHFKLLASHLDGGGYAQAVGLMHRSYITPRPFDQTGTIEPNIWDQKGGAMFVFTFVCLVHSTEI